MNAARGSYCKTSLLLENFFLLFCKTEPKRESSTFGSVLQCPNIMCENTLQMLNGKPDTKMPGCGAFSTAALFEEQKGGSVIACPQIGCRCRKKRRENLCPKITGYAQLTWTGILTVGIETYLVNSALFVVTIEEILCSDR